MAVGACRGRAAHPTVIDPLRSNCIPGEPPPAASDASPPSQARRGVAPPFESSSTISASTSFDVISWYSWRSDGPPSSSSAPTAVLWRESPMACSDLREDLTPALSCAAAVCLLWCCRRSSAACACAAAPPASASAASTLLILLCVCFKLQTLTFPPLRYATSMSTEPHV